MDQTADQIEAHIDQTRERLGSNFRELEGKVEAATDWRGHFRERPHVFLGAAVLGGFVLASVLKSKPAARSLSAVAAQPAARGRDSIQGHARELWHNVQGALLGVAAARIKDYIGELVPDFEDHYRRAEHGATARDPSRS